MIADDNDTVETHEAEYFGCLVEVWRIKGPFWGAFPWRFAVTHDGKRRIFVGVPNYCRTKRSALRRAWYRAMWLSGKDWDNHYH